MSYSPQGLLWLVSWCAFSVLSACSADDEAMVISSSATSAAVTPSVEVETTKEQTYGGLHHGEATYYRATGEGNCSFDASDDLMVAALNTADYSTAAMCGAYIAVSGPKGTVTVRVVDRCPGCKPGGLDLSRQAFERIADITDGRISVTWQVVAGALSVPIAYHYMDGTTRYWTAVQLRNHRWPLAALEILPNGASDWIRVERRAYNYFVHPRPIATGPLRVRVTSVMGEVLEDTLPEPAGEMLVQGAAQFR